MKRVYYSHSQHKDENNLPSLPFWLLPTHLKVQCQTLLEELPIPRQWILTKRKILVNFLIKADIEWSLSIRNFKSQSKIHHVFLFLCDDHGNVGDKGAPESLGPWITMMSEAPGRLHCSYSIHQKPLLLLLATEIWNCLLLQNIIAQWFSKCSFASEALFWKLIINANDWVSS